MKLKFFQKSSFVLGLILMLSLFLRLYGLNWDQGTHLHPDERFLTMVLSAMKIPQSFTEYLDPQRSTMMPYNLGYSFFVYGTFPLVLTRLIGEVVHQTQYWNIHFVGRVLSALADIGTVFLLFKIGKKIFNEKAGLWAAFLYTIMVLPIQLSHFFTVDTFLNFFLVLSFYFLILLLTTHYLLLTTTFLGLSFGLALACKISALYFAPIIGPGYLYLLFKKGGLKKFLVHCALFALLVPLAFRFSQPQAFASANFLNWQPNPQFIKNLNELKSSNDPNSWFPPAIQWKTTTPIIFPLKNLIFWGLGLPLGIISLASMGYALFLIFKKNQFLNFLILFWVFGLFIYNGVQFCKTMRYFLPIYPFLALLSANFLVSVKTFLEKKFSRLFSLTTYYLLLTAILVYPIAFTHIYTQPLTRVTATRWIYKNIPSGSTLLNEEWDDYIPLGLPEQGSWTHQGEMVFMYDWDTPEKWQKINAKLAKVDYIILTSNRAYGSTMKIPEKYPETIKYYQSLFNGTGNFKKVAEFTSHPCFPSIGKHLFCFNDDNAEEAFTVYDHPKVLIFSRK